MPMKLVLMRLSTVLCGSDGTCRSGAILYTLFNDGVTTRDINKAQIKAVEKRLKTLYYIRMRQVALEGTQVEGCVSCAL